MTDFVVVRLSVDPRPERLQFSSLQAHRRTTFLVRHLTSEVWDQTVAQKVVLGRDSFPPGSILRFGAAWL